MGISPTSVARNVPFIRAKRKRRFPSLPEKILAADNALHQTMREAKRPVSGAPVALGSGRGFPGHGTCQTPRTGRFGCWAGFARSRNSRERGSS
jgi:hypothetical protein